MQEIFQNIFSVENSHRWNVFSHLVDYLRILQGKRTLKWKSSAYEKYEYGHLGRWYIKLTLFKRF